MQRFRQPLIFYLTILNAFIVYRLCFLSLLRNMSIVYFSIIVMPLLQLFNVAIIVVFCCEPLRVAFAAREVVYKFN